ncbi:hypothetical protein KM043_009844 [Ampulex compressa]|nr:hypothetical protein KM043_009844 [Ampulex compressa]
MQIAPNALTRRGANLYSQIGAGINLRASIYTVSVVEAQRRTELLLWNSSRWVPPLLAAPKSSQRDKKNIGGEPGGNKESHEEEGGTENGEGSRLLARAPPRAGSFTQDS